MKQKIVKIVMSRYLIITFVEEVVETNDSRDFTAQTDGLSFWHDEREDLYQDYLKEK